MNLHFRIHLGAVGPNKATLPLFFMSLSTHLFIPLRILNNKLYNWNATKLKLSFTMLNWTDWFEFLHFLSTYMHLQRSIRTGRTWNTLSWSKYITIKHIFILQLSKAISQSALEEVSRSLRAKKVWRQSFKWMRGSTVYSWKMKIWGGVWNYLSTWPRFKCLFLAKPNQTHTNLFSLKMKCSITSETKHFVRDTCKKKQMT